MNEKKQSSAWYIAATHWLTSFFLASIMLGLLSVFIGLFQLVTPEQAGGILFRIANLLVIIILFWFTIQYSAKYINKKYIIDDPQMIVNLSTLYVLIVSGGLQLYSILTVGFSLTSFFDLAYLLAMLAAFYMISKRFLVHSATAPTSTPIQQNQE